jgi:hypothetical protein
MFGFLLVEAFVAFMPEQLASIDSVPAEAAAKPIALRNSLLVCCFIISSVMLISFKRLIIQPPQEVLSGAAASAPYCL